MNKSTQFCCVMLGVLCMLISASQAQQTTKLTTGQSFAFKYEKNRPLEYSMGMKVSMDMDMKPGTEHMNIKMIFDMRYHLTLTPAGDPKEGVTAMRFEPSHIEGDWDITGPGGHIVMSLRGADMKGTQDGVVVIDTKKGIGEDQAQDFKKEILPLYLSGLVDLDARGNVKQFRGDIPFVEFWTDEIASQVGLFGIIFPERAIAAGGSWEESITLKKMGQVKLEGDGVRCTVTFTRQPDAVPQGRPLVAFNLSAPFTYKDLTGFMEQNGQITRLNISKFGRRATGTFYFDQDRGVLADGTMKADADAMMNARIQGQSLVIDLQMELDMRLKLLSEKTEAPAPGVRR